MNLVSCAVARRASRTREPRDWLLVVLVAYGRSKRRLMAWGPAEEGQEQDSGPGRADNVLGAGSAEEKTMQKRRTANGCPADWLRDELRICLVYMGTGQFDNEFLLDW